MTCTYVSKEDEVPCQISSYSSRELENDEYCCFHLPFEDRAFRDIKKSEWGSQELKQFQQALQNLINNTPNNAKLNLSGTKIPTEVSINRSFPELELSHAHINGPITIDVQRVHAVQGIASVFEQDVKFSGGGTGNGDFSNSTFKGNLTLESSSFGDFNATKSTIEGNLLITSKTFVNCIFRNSNVHGQIAIQNVSNITETLDFSKVKFPEGSNLTNITVSGNSNFDGSSIPDNAIFTKCNFGDNGSFRGFKTGENVEFRECTFGKNTSFTKIGNRHTNFGKQNSFVNISLGEKSDFTDSKFGIGLRFNSGEIRSECNFSGVRFGSKTKFRNVEIFRTSFCGAKFENQASFSNCNFHHKTDFSNLTFSKSTEGNAPLSFDGSAFNGNTDFNGSEFNGPVSFKDSYFHEVSFSYCTFSKRAIFLNRNFKNSTSFRGSIFEIAPEFHGAIFHQDTDFIDTKFKDTKSVNPVRATASYRTLRHAMEQQRSKRNQSFFHSLELRSGRKTGEVKGVAWFLSLLNDLLSEYGLSVARPFWGFLGINIGFLLFYYFRGSAYGNNQWLPYIRYMMEQIIRPFYVWTGAFKPSEELDCIWSDISGSFLLAASIQSIICIGLITLFVLATRKQFKMD